METIFKYLLAGYVGARRDEVDDDFAAYFTDSTHEVISPDSAISDFLLDLNLCLRRYGKPQEIIDIYLEHLSVIEKYADTHPACASLLRKIL